MCSGGFAKCLGISLLPLAVVCVLCNILLFFPGGKSVDKENITEQVWYFGGILGSGVVVSQKKKKKEKTQNVLFPGKHKCTSL